MKKTISVFGATGSIGRSTLDLIAHNPNDFTVRVLTASKNVELLAAQALQFKPELVVLADDGGYEQLCDLLSAHKDIQVTAGRQALLDAADI